MPCRSSKISLLLFSNTHFVMNLENLFSTIENNSMEESRGILICSIIFEHILARSYGHWTIYSEFKHNWFDLIDLIQTQTFSLQEFDQHDNGLLENLNEPVSDLLLNSISYNQISCKVSPTIFTIILLWMDTYIPSPCL